MLELGVGWRNQLIKAPFMRLVAQEPHAAYVTVNLGEVYISPQIQDKAMGVDGDLALVLPEILEKLNCMNRE